MKPKVAIGAVIILLGLFFTDHFYAAASLSGTVVDAQTDAPVEGAVVLAQWEVSTGGFADEEGCVSELAIRETATDRDGRYSIPGWWLRYSSCLLFPYFRGGRSPLILVFKPGYSPEVRQNEHGGGFDDAFFRYSEWNGRSIPIRRFMGTPQEYTEEFRSLSFEIDDISSHCCRWAPWERMPMMYAAIQQQALDFKAAHVHIMGFMPRLLPPEMQQKPCPSHTEILYLCYGKAEAQSTPCPPAPAGRQNNERGITTTPMEC